MSRHRGFTLVEIAIVLVIIGLLLGGVLKGQELITSARVRNLISQQDGVKAAFFGFQDRYRALPGDYSTASANIKCPDGCFNGDGNGYVDPVNTAGTVESILAWTHLASAGFLTGIYKMAASNTALPGEENNPKNPYGEYLQLDYDGVYATGTTAAPLSAKHNLKTGSRIPVEIIAEVDRKIDDSKPYSGSFQFSMYSSQDPKPISTGSGGCVVDASTWALSGSNNNCGAASLF